MTTRIIDRITAQYGYRPPYKTDKELLKAVAKDLPSLAKLLKML